MRINVSEMVINVRICVLAPIIVVMESGVQVGGGLSVQMETTSFFVAITAFLDLPSVKKGGENGTVLCTIGFTALSIC